MLMAAHPSEIEPKRNEEGSGGGSCCNSTRHDEQCCTCHGDWSVGLAEDVLRLVIRHLPIVGQIAVSRVCASWRKVVLSVRRHDKLRYGLPCLLYMHMRVDSAGATPTYRLIDPVHRDNKHTFEGVPGSMEGARLLFSRDGWLLFMSWPVFPAEQDQRPYMYLCDIYFVNPFSKTRIKLPTLRTKQICGQYSVSDRPTSPSCVVVVVLDVLFDNVEIAFCRPGDTQWTVVERECNVRLYGCLVDPTWCAGSFYCLDRRGSLAAFDPSRQSWTVRPKQDDLGDDINQRLEQYLVESAGDLLRVCGDMGSSVVAVFRFDMPTGRWVPVRDLGDRALFLGRLESISVVAPTDGMRGQVYFNRVRGKDDAVVSCSLRGEEEEEEEDDDARRGDVVLAPSSALGKMKEFLFSSWVDLEWCPAGAQDLEWRSIVFGDA